MLIINSTWLYVQVDCRQHLQYVGHLFSLFDGFSLHRLCTTITTSCVYPKVKMTWIGIGKQINAWDVWSLIGDTLALDAGSSPRRLILDAWGWIEISAWGYRCLAYCSGHIFSDVLLLWYIHSSTFARVLEFALVLVILHCFPVSCFYLRRRGSFLVFGFFVNWQLLEAQTVSISDGGRQCPHHNKKSSDRWSEQHFFPPLLIW